METQMWDMFFFSTFNTDIGLEHWNVQSATDIYHMFGESTINVDMDLSDWDVSNVTAFEEFSSGITETGTLTPPTFKTTQ